MKWNGKVDDKTKEKVELLVKEFDRFIFEAHDGGSSSEDKSIVKEWKNFKSLMEKDPTDIEALHAYINSIQEEKPDIRSTKNALTVSRSNSNITSKSGSKQEVGF